MSVDVLLDGYRRFRNTRFAEARALYERLATEQRPKVMMVACCDSRVDPATITDAGPGELFVVRNVANLVPPFTPDGRHHGTSAALEFGVTALEVGDVVVLGHAQCGGVRALLEGAHLRGSTVDFVGAWMEIAADARARVLETEAPVQDPQRALEYEVVRLSLENLMSYPWIRERVEANRLRLHGWHFGIASGDLAMLDPQTNTFRVYG